MHGPIAATTSARRAPSRSIAASVASVTPPIAPFHPAWAAPTTPALRSASKTGAPALANGKAYAAGAEVRRAGTSSELGITNNART